MAGQWPRLIAAIHEAPFKAVVVVTGGGASAIADLLSVPGGSRTLLEGAVPYSAAALTAWLGREPERFCSEETALAMAAVAFERGRRLATGEQAAAHGDRAADPPPAAEQANVIGIACTASLVSDRPKKGDHRCHVAWQSAATTLAAELRLEKGTRDRPGEEAVVGQLILTRLARAAGIDDVPNPGLLPGEEVREQRVDAEPELRELRLGERKVVWLRPDGTMGDSPETTGTAGSAGRRAVLCGAFNPLHRGHQELRNVAERLLRMPVDYEMSLRNVDKPPLDYLTIRRRGAQFHDHPLALTSAPTFAEKAVALPGVVFVVGVDTAERIVNPRYYGDSGQALREALAGIRERGCRFLVAGRKVGDRFRTLAELEVPAEFAELFDEVPESAFRADVSSTELRKGRAE